MTSLTLRSDCERGEITTIPVSNLPQEFALADRERWQASRHGHAIGAFHITTDENNIQTESENLPVEADTEISLNFREFLKVNGIDSFEYRDDRMTIDKLEARGAKIVMFERKHTPGKYSPVFMDMFTIEELKNMEAQLVIPGGYLKDGEQLPESHTPNDGLAQVRTYLVLYEGISNVGRINAILAAAGQTSKVHKLNL